MPRPSRCYIQYCVPAWFTGLVNQPLYVFLVIEVTVHVLERDSKALSVPCGSSLVLYSAFIPHIAILVWWHGVCSRWPQDLMRFAGGGVCPATSPGICTAPTGHSAQRLCLPSLLPSPPPLPSLAWPYRHCLETCLGLCCVLCGACCGREPASVSSPQRCWTSSWRVCKATLTVTKACCPVCQAGNCVIAAVAVLVQLSSSWLFTLNACGCCSSDFVSFSSSFVSTSVCCLGCLPPPSLFTCPVIGTTQS